jgi:hypothetical protein
LLAAGAANAVTITGKYQISYTPIAGNSPNFTNPSSSKGPRLITGNTTNNKFIDSTDTGYFTINVPLDGAATPVVNFFQINPSSSCGSSCVYGYDIPHHDPYYTQSGYVNVTFSNFNLALAPGNDLTGTGLYQARYGGPSLSCAHPPNSPVYGDTDCINWNEDLAIHFVNGTTLLINLIDAEDWSIRPQINFALVTDPSQTPIPGALPLFVSGAGVFGYFGWRRKQRIGQAARSA